MQRHTAELIHYFLLFLQWLTLLTKSNTNLKISSTSFLAYKAYIDGQAQHDMMRLLSKMAGRFDE